MSTKRILYLSYDGLTDPLGQSQILPYLKGLSGKGYDITIVSFEKRERYQRGKSDIASFCSQHNLRWEPLSYHKSPPVFSTLYDIDQLKRKITHLHKELHFEIVHCRSYITAIAGLWMKKRFGTRFIFDMRGFWADERVEGGLWNLGNPLFKIVYRFFKKKEKDFIREADTVVVLTHAAKGEIRSWQLNDKIEVIPCCVDLTLFDPSLAPPGLRELREKLGLKEQDFVLLYLGSLGTWYLYNEMITFFKSLKQIIPSAKFLFLTPDKEQIAPDPDFIVATAGRQEVPKYIQLSNASICFIKPSFSKKGSSATKMAEVMAMGIPVVTNPGWGDVAFLKDKLNLLYITTPEHYIDTAQQLMHTTPVKPNSFFSTFYSLDHGVEIYAGIYQSLTLIRI